MSFLIVCSISLFFLSVVMSLTEEIKVGIISFFMSLLCLVPVLISANMDHKEVSELMNVYIVNGVAVSVVDDEIYNMNEILGSNFTEGQMVEKLTKEYNSFFGLQWPSEVSWKLHKPTNPSSVP